MLLLLALAGLTGCAVPTTASNDLARAQRAGSLGHEWTAMRLYRAAGHGGSLEAQMHLANTGARNQSVAARLLTGAPDASEQATWLRAATANAERRAARGEATGHHALGLLAAFGPDRAPGQPASDASYAEARRHFETAVALGDARAAQQLAVLVWMQDGLLASEPYFRASYDAGNAGAGGMLSMIALHRPAIERGESLRDAPGDLSRLDAVGGIRTMREVDPAEAETRLAALRAQAGTAQADSLMRVLGAANLL